MLYDEWKFIGEKSALPVIAQLKHWHQRSRARVIPSFIWRWCPAAASHSLAGLPINQSSWILAQKPTLGPIWKSNSQKNISTAEQLSAADNSCWLLMKMEINLESWNLANITAVIRCQQLSTPVDSWWKWKSTITAVISCLQPSTDVNSCQDLFTADKNKNQHGKLKLPNPALASAKTKLRLYNRCLNK